MFSIKIITLTILSLTQTNKSPHIIAAHEVFKEEDSSGSEKLLDPNEGIVEQGEHFEAARD